MRDMGQMSGDARRKGKEVKSLLRDKMPVVIGEEARRFILDNFKAQSYTDKSVKPWTTRKRSTASDRRIKRKRAILVQSGDLRDNWAYHTAPYRCTVYNDLAYAKVHNEGGRAGRNRAARIPQRQMMGQSDKLNNMIQSKLDREMTKIMTK